MNDWLIDLPTEGELLNSLFIMSSLQNAVLGSS